MQTKNWRFLIQEAGQFVDYDFATHNDFCGWRVYERFPRF